MEPSGRNRRQPVANASNRESASHKRNPLPYRYRRAHDDPPHRPRGHRGRRPRGRTAFFVELGLKLQGEGPVEEGWVDRVVGLEGVRVDHAMVETADCQGRLELVKFHSPSVPGRDGHAANILGIRHVAFVVDDIDAVVATVRACGGELVGEVENYEDIYRLCYVRGPEGIIVELAERIG